MEDSHHEDCSALLKLLMESVNNDNRSDLLDAIYADNMGITVEEYRARAALNVSLHEEGASYDGLPACEWPHLTFNWDFTRKGQRFGFDGVTSEVFQAMYPEGLRLARMSLVAFDQHLAHFSRRDTSEELWSLGCRSKLAKTIAYIRRGYVITPPIVGPTGKEVILKGGHHRYAIAKAVQLDTIPFLVAPDDVKAIENLLDVTWLGTAD